MTGGEHPTPTNEPRKPKTGDAAPPILVDAEPRSGGHTTWRAGGPGIEELKGRIFFSSAAEAVDAINRSLPKRQVILCPATETDRKEAGEAAEAAANASVGPYPTWIEERRGHVAAWAIHWPRKARGARRTTGAPTLATACRRIRNRQPRAAIRIVVKTEKGRNEVASLPSDPNTLVREHLAPHVI